MENFLIIDLLQVSTDINYLSDSEIPVGGHFVLVVISKGYFLIPVSQSSSKMIEIREKKSQNLVPSRATKDIFFFTLLVDR